MKLALNELVDFNLFYNLIDLEYKFGQSFCRRFLSVKGLLVYILQIQ